jgi:hypothetical protein
MTANAFRITLADNTVVGLCFEPILALANHSCNPNASVMFDGRIVSLRALDSIKKDEQIFISYIDCTSSRSTRQEELKDHYFFTCKCEKCSRDDSPYSSWQKHSHASNPKIDLLIPPRGLLTFARSMPKTQSPSSALERRSVSSSSSKQDLKNALLSPFQPPHHTLLHDLYLQHLNSSSYGSALTILLFVHLHSDPILYPQPHHPMRTIRLFTLSKLCLQLVSPDTPPLPSSLSIEYREIMESVDWISAAQILLILAKEGAKLSHGVESKFFRHVEGELEDVESVQRSRGTAGRALKLWGDGSASEEGVRYAERICEGLRVVGGKECAEAVIGTALLGVRR